MCAPCCREVRARSSRPHCPARACVQVCAMPARDVDADLRKRLWLVVAQSVVQRAGSSAKDAIAVLHASGGVLRVEDVLVFFPDLTLIDDFKASGQWRRRRGTWRVGRPCTHTRSCPPPRPPSPMPLTPTAGRGDGGAQAVRRGARRARA